MVVVFTGGGDFDPWAQGEACRSGVVQIAPGFLVLISCENLSGVLAEGGTTGLVTVRGGPLQGENLLRLRTEDFMRCKVGVICRSGKRKRIYLYKQPRKSRNVRLLIIRIHVHSQKGPHQFSNTS